MKLYIMKPDHVDGTPGVVLFIHGGVWIVGNFENHKRLLRDIVVESGQPAVFLQYTTLPEAKYPVQMNQAYAALEWTATHAGELGADPNRIAVWAFSGGGPFLSLALTGALPPARALVAYYAALDLQEKPPGASPALTDEIRRDFSPIHHMKALAGKVTDNVAVSLS